MDLVKNFKWTNDDQNIVSAYIAQDGMSPDDAAKKWIEENPDKVDAWLELSRAAIRPRRATVPVKRRLDRHRRLASHCMLFPIAHSCAYAIRNKEYPVADVPSQAKCVVIGAGIVGNSLVHHLAELGWTDIVQIDKGPLPNPGGSTGHASNFIFLTDHSREITDLTLDSVAQYREMGVLVEPGGFEVARTEERMEELRRRMSSAKAWGIEGELVSPEFVQEKVPFLDKDQIIGAFWQPGVGVVDSLRAGTIMRERALAKGVLTVVPNVEVTDLGVDGRPHHRGRAPPAATSRPRPWSSPAACGAPRSPTWPA